jgi:hypothetical protein
MGFFAAVPWKSLAGAVPLLIDLMFKSRVVSGDAEKEQKEINELKAQIKALDSEIASLCKGLRIIITMSCVVFLIAVAALIIAIIAVSKCPCSI